MKKFSKILSVALLVALVLSLGVANAFAAGETYTGKITVSNATVGQTYTLYKVFDATIVEGREAEADGINYTVPASWNNFPTNDYFGVDAAGNVTYKGTTTTDGSLSADAIEWLKEQKSNFRQIGQPVVATAPTDNPDATKTTVVFTGLEPGYYYVESTVGAAVTINSITPDVTVIDKNKGDIIIKDLKGGDTGDTWKKSNTADIGDVIDFRITVTVQPNSENAVVYDVLSNGLTLVESSAPVVSIAADYYNVRVFKAAAEKYTYSYNESPSGTAKTKDVTGNIVIDFKQSWIDTLTTATDVTIQYKAIVNPSAQIATDIPNDVDLIFGHNYDMESHDRTITRTYEFGLYKTEIIDDNGEVHKILSGAEFKLYSDAEATTEIALVKEAEGVYRPATAEEKAVSGFQAATIQAGAVIVKGLQNGTYYLKETKAPAGYNIVNLVFPVTINNANVEGEVSVEGVYQYVDADNDPATDPVASGGVEVINQKGTQLPSTGGIGTTIFYVVGGVLVLAAIILLVTKKRMSE